MKLKNYLFTTAIAVLIPVACANAQENETILTTPSVAQACLLGLKTVKNIGNNIITEEEIVGLDDANIKSQPKKKKKKKDKKEKKYDNRWNIELTDEEIDLLAKILWIEARGESDKGQKAVVEVVFNRMVHDAFKGSIEEVLSAKNQFSSWKNRDSAKPTDKEYDNIKEVLNGNTKLFNSQVVYFSTSPRNNIGTIHIGGHYFCEYEIQ